MNAYLASVIENVKKKYANEPEFVQCVEEVLTSLEPVIEQRPDIVKAGIVERCDHGSAEPPHAGSHGA